MFPVSGFPTLSRSDVFSSSKSIPLIAKALRVSSPFLPPANSRSSLIGVIKPFNETNVITSTHFRPFHFPLTSKLHPRWREIPRFKNNSQHKLASTKLSSASHNSFQRSRFILSQTGPHNLSESTPSALRLQFCNIQNSKYNYSLAAFHSWTGVTVILTEVFSLWRNLELIFRRAINAQWLYLDFQIVGIILAEASRAQR